MTRRFATSEIGVVFVVFVGMSFGLGVIGPVLGELQSEFNVSLATLGLVLATPTAARIVATLPAGILFDRMPARIPLSTGTLLLTLGASVCAVTPNYAVLLVGLFIGGFSTALVFTSGMGHAVRITTARARSRITGKIMAGAQLGGFLAPITAGVTANAFGWRAVFWLAAMIGLVATAAVWTTVWTERPTRESRQTSRWHPSQLGLNRGIGAVVAFTILLWGATYSVKQVVLPLYGSVGLALDPATIGIVLSISGAIRTVVMFASGSILDRFGRSIVLAFASSLGTVAVLLITLSPTISIYILIAILYALGGITTALPPVLVAERTRPETLGRALGSMQLLVDLVLLWLPLLLGLIIDEHGFGTVGTTLAILYFAAMLVGLWIMRVRPQAAVRANSTTCTPTTRN
jgi:DHA1 family inner membrane transport protein